MKILFSLIVLTTLVARLPQLQAAPTDIISKLAPIIQSLMKLLLESQDTAMEKATVMNNGGIYATSCPQEFVRSNLDDTFAPLGLINLYMRLSGQNQDVNVEIKCNDPNSMSTTIINHNTSDKVQLHRSSTGTCTSDSNSIRIGRCSSERLTPYESVEIPVGSTGRTVAVDVLFTQSGGVFNCIELKNFGTSGVCL